MLNSVQIDISGRQMCLFQISKNWGCSSLDESWSWMGVRLFIVLESDVRSVKWAGKGEALRLQLGRFCLYGALLNP
jgi:hypothetical protein